MRKDRQDRSRRQAAERAVTPRAWKRRETAEEEEGRNSDMTDSAAFVQAVPVTTRRAVVNPWCTIAEKEIVRISTSSSISQDLPSPPLFFFRVLCLAFFSKSVSAKKKE